MFNKILPVIVVSLASCVAYADTTMVDADTSLQADMSYAAPAADATPDVADTGMVQNADGTYSVAEPSTEVATDVVAVDSGAVDTTNYYTDANVVAVEPAMDTNADTTLATDAYMTTDVNYAENPDATQGDFTVDAAGNVQDVAAEQETGEVLENEETMAASTIESNSLQIVIKLIRFGAVVAQSSLGLFYFCLG